VRPDLLDPAATEAFISLVYEPHRKALQQHFGRSIRLVFTDEPAVPNPPWTGDCAAAFRREKGYDLLGHLPSLFAGDRPEDMRVRIDFFDWWSGRFARAYFRRLRRWCRENGLLFGGHLGGEDTTVHAREHGYGHILRVLREFDVPGVDAIWRQLVPGRGTAKFRGRDRVPEPNHHFPKFASSVAHQGGRRWALTESFCVYGSGITFDQMKWVTDFQYARGINLMTIGVYPLAMRDHYMGMERPMFGPFNPVWPYADIYHEYVARLGYLMSRGVPDVETAVYYPVRDIWAGGPGLRSVGVAYDRLVQHLLETQRDFDLIDDDILAKSSTRIVRGLLHVGPMRYRAVCVARCAWMTDAAKEKLAAFARQGGAVLWFDGGRGARQVSGATRATFSRGIGRTRPTVLVEPACRALRVCKRRIAGGSIYLLTNEGPGEVTCDVTFPGKVSAPVLPDPATGRVRRPARACRGSAGWRVGVTLPFAGSCVVLFSRQRVQAEPPAAEPGELLMRLAQGWSLRPAVSFRIGAHAIRKTRMRVGRVRTAPGDWRNVCGREFSGDGEYVIDFHASAETAARAALLDLGDVRYACSARLNGKPLGRRVWHPFRFEVAGLLKAGANQLRVTVTNTLANQYLTTRALDRWTDRQLGPYHRHALLLERDSLSGGLIGPVSFLAARRTDPAA
jgi:hypothetical protein